MDTIMIKLQHLAVLFILAIFMLSVPAHAACIDPTGSAGAMLYNSDVKTMQFCNGTNWIDMGAGTGSVGQIADINACNDGFAIKWDADNNKLKCVSADDMPDPFTFTDLTAQELSTLVTSNIVTPGSYIGPIPVTITGQGNPEISIDGGAWATSGNLNNGDTVQARLTTGATYETIHTATITIGQTSDSWTVETKIECNPAFRATDSDMMGTFDPHCHSPSIVTCNVANIGKWYYQGGASPGGMSDFGGGNGGITGCPSGWAYHGAKWGNRRWDCTCN